jgi:hypothetical protein
MILMTMLGGIGTLWGPVLGAFIFIPAADLILFEFSPSAIHLSIMGGLMMGIILFMPRGILPTLGDWLAKWAAPRRAHEGALSMADLRHKQGRDPLVSKQESAATIEPETPY